MLNFQGTNKNQIFIKVSFDTLISYSNKFEGKPSHNILYQLYMFDFELRKILFEYCVKAEVQFKAVLANAVSLKTGDAGFYLDENNYTKIKRRKR